MKESQDMRRFCKYAALLAVGLTLGGCYSLGRRDLFEVPFRPIAAVSLQALSDPGHQVHLLPVTVDGRTLSAYVDEAADARGSLIFFDGNGYGAETALKAILPHTRALHLDLVVFNYFDEGQPTPSVAEMRAISRALVDATGRLPGQAGTTIYAGGHSLGASFAIDLASDPRIAGVFAAAPMTTGVAMIHHQLWYSHFAWLRATADYRQLDTVQFAAKARAPMLLFGAAGDRDLPPRFTHQVFAALPPTLPKREVILSGIDHSGYLVDPMLWKEVADFFKLN